MQNQLAYALITPYSLLKSRTGGIIGRILSHPELEFVGARMFVFSDEFIDEYKNILCPPDAPADITAAWQEYIDRNLRVDNPTNTVPRCMVLLFSGPDAVRVLKEEVVGTFTESPVGDTVRGTFGDFIRDADGKIHYFEPAVITCPRPAMNNSHLKLLAKYIRADGGVLAGRIKYDNPEPVECSLVLIKPDNFYRPSRRPGNIIDTFSRTGLRIVGANLFNMTVSQGEEFYGPLKDIFVEKLQFLVTREVQKRLDGAFEFEFDKEDAQVLAHHLAKRNAICEFNKIVEYMTGINPETLSDESLKATSSDATCLALLYEGPGAIEKIRTVLGATDPAKADPGTVRIDFGRDLMRNGAHASDSTENASRERKIVGITGEESDGVRFGDIIDEYLANS